MRKKNGKTRSVSTVWSSRPTIEGAGVRLHRVFGTNEVTLTDPFLLLDDFHSGDPMDYIAGFPWHPHRGIETVTYMIAGEVEHGDSLKNKGVIRSGDVQWMTAGSGIIHQEMPSEFDGFMQGFQLWVNLPKKDKMMKPRYRGIEAKDIPTVKYEGVSVKVIAGEVDGVRGPVIDLVVDAEYLDIRLNPGKRFTHKVGNDHTVLVYVYGGEALIGDEEVGERTIALLADGDAVEAIAGKTGAQLLLIAGKPLKEPIAWAGPIVMNTQKELEEAYRELDKGTFIKT